MPLKSQLPRRSLRQQGRNPEPNYQDESSNTVSASNPTSQGNPHQNQPTTINQTMPSTIDTAPTPMFHQPGYPPMYGTTMSHDRTQFIPAMHDMASRNLQQQTVHQIPAISVPNVQQQGYATTHGVTIPSPPSSATNSEIYSFTPTQNTISSDARPKGAASTNSIINNAENIIRHGNTLQSNISQGGYISTTPIPTPAQSIYTHMDSSIQSHVTPPMPHISIPQVGFYPQIQPNYYSHHHNQVTGSNALLEQLARDNKQLQDTFTQHMADSKEQIKALLKQIDVLQTKLQKAMDQNEKLSDTILQLSVQRTHPTPITNHPTVDLLDLPQPPPNTDQAPTAKTQQVSVPPKAIPTQTPQAPPVSNTTANHQDPLTLVNNDLIQRLIKISETQLQIQSQKKDSRNNKFPTFNGEHLDEFLTWYNNVLSILASTGWNELYDTVNDCPIDEDTAQRIPKLASLSSDLYSYLHVSMRKDAQMLMEDKHEIRGKGLFFLQTLFDSYNVRLAGGELMEKEKQYANLCRKKDEKISTFAARCKKLRRILKFNGIHTSSEGLKLRFIMGLGPDFSDIQKNLHNLPKDWQTCDMKELTITATSYLNSILSIRKNNAWYKAQSAGNPTPTTTSQESKKQTQPRKNNAQRDNDKTDNAKKFQTQNSERQARIIKDIQAGTFNPNDYVHEVPKGACVWHGTVHRDPKCTVLSNLIEPTVSKSALKSSNFTNPNPTAKHTMQTTVAARTQTPPPMTDINIMDLDNFDRLPANSTDNSTNNISHSYSLSNNNISRRVLISEPQPSNQTQIQHTFVLDSGAFPHMCKDTSLFTHLYPWQPSSSTTEVTLADGLTTAKVEGIGTISLELNKHKVTLHNVLLVPSLSESLFSIKQHCVSKGNYFHTENNQATLAFPEFLHTTPISDEIIIK